MLVLITILTTLTLTTTIAAYAGGDDNNNGDGNKQKAEDDSSAAIADCDDNDVERAGFDCIAIAANDVEIEQEEEPPGEGLVVCKEVNDPNQEVVPFDFRFIVISSDINVQFQGFPPPECSEGILSFVGEYEVTEDTVGSNAPLPDRVEVEGDCVQDPTNPLRATGEVEEGETEECTFINTYEEPPPPP